MQIQIPTMLIDKNITMWEEMKSKCELEEHKDFYQDYINNLIEELAPNFKIY